MVSAGWFGFVPPLIAVAAIAVGVALVWKDAVEEGAFAAAIGAALSSAAASIRTPILYWAGSIEATVVTHGLYMQLKVTSAFEDEFRVWVTSASNYEELVGIPEPSLPWTLKWREDGGSPKQLWWLVTPSAPEIADLLSHSARQHGGPEFKMYSVARPEGWRAIPTGDSDTVLSLVMRGRRSSREVRLDVPLDANQLAHGGATARS